MNNEQLTTLKNIVNEELSSGKSLKAILKKYGIQKKDFNKIKYTYNAHRRQFENVGQLVKAKVDHKRDEGLNEVAIDVVHNLEDSMPKAFIREKEPIDEILPDEELKSDNVRQAIYNDYINNNLDVLAEIIENYKNNKNNNIIDNNTIIIKLPTEKDKNFKASVRINDIIWEKFKNFCKSHKQFTQKELASQALLDFIEKHQ